MQSQQQVKGWHIHNWGFWGWLETAIKSVGIIAGFIAFSQTMTVNPIQVAGGSNVVAAIILGILTLLLSFAVVLRLMQREVISVVFALANALGHAGLLFYLVRTPENTVLPLVFGVAFVLGELVKQRFLAITGYTENGAQTPQMLLFVRGLMVVYLIFTLLVLF
jgi:hypothetical protein